jgi:hypothetical protein
MMPSTSPAKRILIIGFPHCGTTILKSIIGHINDVEEIIPEVSKIDYINENTYKLSNKQFITTQKKYILAKWPFINDDFFGPEYEDYIRIFIIRNPIYVYSSLNRRFEGRADTHHNKSKYEKTCQKFIEYRTNPVKDIYTIKYEEIFEDENYTHLCQMLNDIGFLYDMQIFNNSLYINRHTMKISVEKTPKNYDPKMDHEMYRTYQINQPFTNNNDDTKLCLLKDDIAFFKASSIIRELYPEVLSVSK